jgi:hypothetical protein
MAQKITVALEDDLDGGPADETVRSAISGTPLCQAVVRHPPLSNY